jgi:hypothetical protein
VQGQDERTLFSKSINPSSGYTIVTKFVPNTYTMEEGDWRIWCEVRDKSSKVRRFNMTATPEGAEVFLKLRKTQQPVGTALVPPTANPAAGIYGAHKSWNVTLKTSTTGATIEYQLGTYGQDVPTAAWLNYTAPIAVTAGAGVELSRTIFARTRSSGGAYSAVAAFTYIYSP